jgi:hypothetical protein
MPGNKVKKYPDNFVRPAYDITRGEVFAIPVR